MCAHVHTHLNTHTHALADGHLTTLQCFQNLVFVFFLKVHFRCMLVSFSSSGLHLCWRRKSKINFLLRFCFPLLNYLIKSSFGLCLVSRQCFMCLERNNREEDKCALMMMSFWLKPALTALQSLRGRVTLGSLGRQWSGLFFNGNFHITLPLCYTAAKLGSETYCEGGNFTLRIIHIGKKY